MGFLRNAFFWPYLIPKLGSFSDWFSIRAESFGLLHIKLLFACDKVLEGLNISVLSLRQVPVCDAQTQR